MSQYRGTYNTLIAKHLCGQWALKSSANHSMTNIECR